MITLYALFIRPCLLPVMSEEKDDKKGFWNILGKKKYHRVIASNLRLVIQQYGVNAERS